MKIKLKKFDMKEITDDKVIVLLGKRNTGKSWLCRDILYYHKDIPVGTVISATESANQFYSHMVPSVFIHDECSADIIHNVIKRQKIITKKIRKEEAKTQAESQIDPRTFLILDDCLYDTSWTKDANIRSVFLNGRHFKVLFLLTMQYPLGIPPNLRTNIDYVFILRETNINNRRRIYENYAGCFPTFETFCNVLDATTNDFECLVINNAARSNKIEDQVFWYKAETHPPFRMGAKKFWDLQDEEPEVSEEEDEDNQLCELNSFKGARKGPRICVRKY